MRDAPATDGRAAAEAADGRKAASGAAQGGAAQAGADALRAIRDEIDRIDLQLCDLMRQRTALSDQVAAAKRAQGNSRPIRPAREAQIVREMVGRLSDEVPVVSTARIWHELIAGAIAAHQGGLTVLVHDNGLWELSRERFGSASSLELCPDMPVVLRRLRENLRTVAVMPLAADDDPEPWWARMIDVDGPQPRVIARLPFVSAHARRPSTQLHEAPGAVAVAAGAEPEPSGDDMTLLIVEYGRDYSRASVVEGMRQQGWTVRDLMSWRAPDTSPVNRTLVELAGFVGVDDPGLGRVRDAARGHVHRIVHFGGYPAPLGAKPAAPRSVEAAGTAS